MTAQHTQLGAHTGITTDTLTASGVVNTTAVSSLQDASVALSTYRTEAQFDFTASGGVWSGDAYASTLNGSMTAWTGYINGQRGTISAVTAHAFAASKDTYVDVLNSSGVFSLVYTATASNNAASPALAANSIRLAIVVTGAGSIAAATSINQGQVGRLLPIASSIPYETTDSLGNLICNRSANPTVIGLRTIVGANFTSATAGSLVDVTGLSTTVLVTNALAGRRFRVEITSSAVLSSGAAGGGVRLAIRDSSNVQYNQTIFASPGVSYSESPIVKAYVTLAAGTYTFKASVQQDNAGTITFQTAATTPGTITVEPV